tara:strand:- start:264 stop:4421 length:4158 start_codon:yes stop_codon:yes gene_type:complete
MPTYTIQGDDGKRYSIDGPEGATEEQVIDAIQEQLNKTKTDVIETKSLETPKQVEETTFSDVAQGVGSGLVRGLVVEPTKTVFNLMGNSERADKVEKSFNKFQEYSGLTPESGGGKIAERLSGFLGSFLGLGKVAKVFKIAQKPLKLGEKATVARRVQQAGRTSVRGGASEFLSSPDNAVTLSDSFDALPDALKTDNEIKVNSIDEAKRRISNKLKLGAEATAFGLAVEAAFPIVGVVAKSTLQLPGVPSVMNAVSKGFSFLGSSINRGLGRFPEKYFASKGVTPNEVYEQLADIKGITKLDADKIAANVASFEKELKKVVGGQNLFGRGRLGINQAHNNLYDFLTNRSSTSLDSYGAAVKTAATKMRTHIDDLSTQFRDDIQTRITSGELDANYGNQLVNIINEQQGEYIRRVYEGAFSKGETLAQIRSKPEYAEAVRKIASGFPEDENAAIRATEIVEDIIKDNSINGGITAQETMKKTAAALRQGPSRVAQKALYEISEDLLQKRSPFLQRIPELRQLLNETKDPLNVYKRTIEDMSMTLNGSRLYSSLSAQLKVNADEGISSLSAGGRPLIISGENLTDVNSINFLKQNGYVKLGEYKPQRVPGSVLDEAGGAELTEEVAEKMSVFGGKYGKLSGDYVAPEVYNSLTMGLRGDGIFNTVWGASLQLKGLAQMTKTVYNPLSQIRNFNSGVFFIGANGNIMRNMNLGESMALSFKQLQNLSTKEQKEFFDLTARLGIRDENLVVNEFKELIQNEGKDYGLLGLVDKIPGAKPLQRLYTGTDTYWKTVGFLAEKAKYSAAFRKAGIQNVDEITDDLIKAGIAKRQKNELISDIDGLDILAGDIVKDTMPIYSRVPEVVKKIRRVPFFGAFASFPAEVIRNSTNILSRGVDELAFTASPELISKIGANAAKQLQKQIRGIGAQRLTGYISSAYIVPKATVMTAQKLTGVSDEELEKIRIHALPDYMLGHNIMPLTGIKKDSRGEYQFEYADLSYMMPYDFVLQPARAAIDVYNKKGFLEAQDVDDVGIAIFEAFKNFSEPFAGESLFAERIFDVLPNFRDGRTSMGIKIYDQADAPGTKMKKRIAHVLNAFNPAILEQTIFKPVAVGPGGRFDIEQGRIGKAFTEKLTGEVVPSKSGIVYDVPSEILTAFTGVRGLKANLNDSLYYGAKEFTRERNNIKTTLNAFIDDANIKETDIVQGFTDANNTLFKLQQNLYAKIKSLKELGMDDNTIFKVMRLQGKMSEKDFEFISRGKFAPYSISKDLIQDFYNTRIISNEPTVAKEFPRVEIAKIYDDLNGKSLEVSGVEEAQKIDFDMPSETTLFGKPKNVSKVVTPPPQKSIIPQKVKSSTLSEIIGTTNTMFPELLGGNPIEAAKNLQILQRRNQ